MQHSVHQEGRDRWSSQSVKRMLTAPLFACDAARSDGPWLADRCRRSSPLALRPHRGGECPALVHPCFERQVVEPFHQHHLRTDQPVIVEFETPTASAFVVQLKAGVPDQVDDRLCVEHRQLWLSFDDPDDRVIGGGDTCSGVGCRNACDQLREPSRHRCRLSDCPASSDPGITARPRRAGRPTKSPASMPGDRRYGHVMKCED